MFEYTILEERPYMCSRLRQHCGLYTFQQFSNEGLVSIELTEEEILRTLEALPREMLEQVLARRSQGQ